VALKIVEMQMQFATGDVSPPLSVPVGQWNNRIIDKICGCERPALSQQVHQADSIGLKETVGIGLIAFIV
jgi:hypothetical protein